LFFDVVKYEAVVEYAHFNVWKAQLVAAFFGQFFPITDGIVRDVADCSSDETVFAVLCLVCPQNFL
jgi:hypothetical protein